LRPGHPRSVSLAASSAEKDIAAIKDAINVHSLIDTYGS
jgi:hypothetical protein